jgi:peroxiredoxin Q/BCP
MLAIGDRAPDPEVVTHTDGCGPLSRFWAEGPLILFFYPKDNTSICTKQACTLQSSFAEFAEFKAAVVGSSTGSVASHKGFAEKHGLSFPLVADEGGKLAKAFGAFRSLIRISKRITYVIGSDGTILDRIHNELSVTAHLDMVRRALAR